VESGAAQLTEREEIMPAKKDIISISFSSDDVISMAELAGVDEKVALERCEEWAKSITDNSVETINEMLYNVIEYGQP